VSGWLIDESALVRLRASPDADRWSSRIDQGLVRITPLTMMQIGFSARSARDRRQLLDDLPIVQMPVEYLTPGVEDRAVDVHGLLAERGRHRALSAPEILLLAATAELADLTVLHLDKDFELIAGVTGQPLERLRSG